jgi:mRNA interferase RelE/StbE
MSRTKWFMKSNFKPRAVKDLKGIDRRDARRVVEKIKAMRDDLAGDVKRLTNSTPNTDFE